MELTARAFVTDLMSRRSEQEQRKIARYFKGGDGTEIIGVRMKETFDLAKRCTDMPLEQVERLLSSPYYEARMGAVSILDFKARKPSVGPEGRRSLYELYLRRHDRINNWDLVDRSAPRVIGWYLLDRSRDPLFDLATSADIWHRRTAIVATFWFIRQGDVDDALKIAEILLHDDEELINKPVGTALREVSKIDEAKLVTFVQEHVTTMPRVTLRYAVEKLSPERRTELLSR